MLFVHLNQLALILQDEALFHVLQQQKIGHLTLFILKRARLVLCRVLLMSLEFIVIGVLAITVQMSIMLLHVLYEFLYQLINS